MSSVEEDSSKNNKPKKLTSWIWQYFKEETKEVRKGEECINVLFMVCQVKEDPSSDICDTEYARKDSSTGNAISHLRSKHNIVQSEKVNILMLNWIISDSLPIHMVQSEAFQHFIYELDPAFMMFCEETVRKIIYEVYNYSFPQLKNTTYVRYPHTSAHIKDTLVNILNKWNIHEKVYIITTDNASNMKKCVQDIEGVEQLAYTLQLIISKGLLNELKKEIALQNEEEDNEQDEDLRPILRPFAEATDLLGGSNYCTFSIINPILIQIKKQFAPPASHNVNHDYDEETAFDNIIDDDDQQFTTNS
ncbi:zinc finger BED domain-containing protein 4-like [Rhizophagus clarus]|uniref:Zinc finger BED domain-containing protein 4-like n=1 Tax=Rhizophagus clarus TaxID=94130 RepID=A0A8H3QFK1_9GLOM|nr:zinc finger BED domain-containing protein 4-like [Rhizophagus clarus]